ncbi:MAG: aminotransferase class V-fold PLP-dependent enzyme [Oscillospiraceae bacterium]|nr:aminotransferase class V-fold PLP-dependent enzyme [Oscillospiraceae bacterium]
MIYLDNAATTVHKPPSVAEAVFRAINTMGNSSRGTHESSLEAAGTVFETRCKLSRLFGCPGPEKVAFTANATEALNMAISGLLRPGDHVITTDCEHNSVLRPLYRLEDEGIISLSFVPADREGVLDYDAFYSLIRPETRAIVCTHASNLTGNVTDISVPARAAAEHGLCFILDASQTAGAMPVRMEEQGIDILCFTGHKGLMGPQGTGGICLRRDAALRPLKVGGSGVQSYNRSQPAEMPTHLEAGTLNAHGIAGLSAALDFLEETGIEAVQFREQALMRRFYEGVRDIPGVTVYGDFSRPHAGIVALNIRNYDSGEVSDVLSVEYDIATRPGAHCAPRMHRALGTEGQGAVRFSFSWFNTEREIDTAIEAVEEIAAR